MQAGKSRRKLDPEMDIPWRLMISVVRRTILHLSNLQRFIPYRYRSNMVRWFYYDLEPEDPTDRRYPAAAIYFIEDPDETSPFEGRKKSIFSDLG
jgi:hypothetical protein